MQPALPVLLALAAALASGRAPGRAAAGPGRGVWGSAGPGRAQGPGPEPAGPLPCPVAARGDGRQGAAGAAGAPSSAGRGPCAPWGRDPAGSGPCALWGPRFLLRARGALRPCHAPQVTARPSMTSSACEPPSCWQRLRSHRRRRRSRALRSSVPSAVPPAWLAGERAAGRLQGGRESRGP